jgi:hypothetical protein
MALGSPLGISLDLKKIGLLALGFSLFFLTFAFALLISYLWAFLGFGGPSPISMPISTRRAFLRHPHL